MVKRQTVHPPGWGPAQGYTNGWRAEHLLFIAGQIGAENQPDGSLRVVSPEFVPQFEKALSNVVEIVRAAGGKPEHVVEMTVYVAGMARYRASRKTLGPVWKRHMGAHYPAMTLVAVAELYETGALVEIRAIAALEGP